MSNDSSSEKTEEPTPKRLRDARAEGQVSKSQDVVTAALVLIVFWVIKLMWPYSISLLTDLFNYVSYYEGVTFREAYIDLTWSSYIIFLKLILPILGVVTVVSIFANIFQVGFLFAPKVLLPKLERLNPAEGLKKIFSLKNVIEFLKSVLKVTFLIVVIYFLVRRDIEPLILVPFTGINGVLNVLGPLLWDFAKMVAMAYIVIAFFDYFFQQRQYMQEMRMTRDEVKREYKEMEGDPEIKSKRKQLAEEMVMEDSAQNTRKSSVLVTNPTHLAVALLYRDGVTKLPIVMAKGQGFFAEHMMKVAQESNIPILQNIPLAHSLYEQSNVLRYVPKDLLEPVAEVIRWVYQLENERKQQGF